MQAMYSEFAVSRGLRKKHLELYFEPTGQGWRLTESIRSRVRFLQFNLLKPLSILGKFDVIFCRNVLIYFSDEIKRIILSRMVEALKPGGYLFLSSTEGMPIGFDAFECVPDSATRYFRLKT